MALHRGIQSAIFYYLSCAPCADYRYRKRRKQEAQRDRADRDALEAHMPGLYRHPSPSSTNPYWQAEIDAGPIPSRTKKKVAESQRGGKPGTAQSGGGSPGASSVSLNAAKGGAQGSDSGRAGFGPYQREDETLWGSQASGLDFRTQARRTGSSSDSLPTRPPKAKLRDAFGRPNYQHTRNAAINDLHPPTTRKVNSREEVLWMLQPPPVADVMSGREAIALSRTSSASSRPSASSSALMSRQVSQRYIDREPQACEGAMLSFSRQSSRKDFAIPQFQENRHPDSPESHDSRRASRGQGSDETMGSATTVVRRASQAPRPADPEDEPRNRKAASRPQLSTILSDSMLSSMLDENARLQAVKNHEPSSGNLKDSTARRVTPGGIDVKRPSETAPAAATVQAKRLSSSLPWMEARIRVPAKDSIDEAALDFPACPETFDSWYTPEFELPQWIHDHTRREVRQRWSFDM